MPGSAIRHRLVLCVYVVADLVLAAPSVNYPHRLTRAAATPASRPAAR